MQLNASARESTFRRANVSLAGCSSAEPASVLVRLLISVQETIFTTCRKSQPHSVSPIPFAYDLFHRGYYTNVN